MTMKKLLLVSAVALLVTVTPTSSAHERLNENLNRIIDLAESYNKTIVKELFVEDVSYLAEGADRCQDKFFCKVYDILHEHTRKEERELARNLKIFIEGRKPNCTELLSNMTSTREAKPIPVLVDHLVECIRSRNINPRVTP